MNVLAKLYMYKIVQMVPALGWGGAQIFTIELCNELMRKQDYDVTLVSMYHHNPEVHLPLDMLDKRIKFITLGKHKGPDLKIFSRIRDLLTELKPDVVHTHLHTGYYCFPAYMNANSKSYRKIHTIHNLVKKDSPWHGRLAYKYFFRKNIIHPVTISQEVYKSAVHEYGSCIKTLINNGSDPARPTAEFEKVSAYVKSLKKDEHTKVLLNVARISPQKNQQLLLDCMAALEKEGENVIALILGDALPDDKPMMEKLIATKPGNVHFLGKVKNVGDYYLNADAFVLSSVFEGLPISLLEALSVGVIPVCTPAGGTVDIVKDNIGYLSKEINYNSFLDALRKYLHAGKSKTEAMKANSIELYRKEFSMESCAERYIELYHTK